MKLLSQTLCLCLVLALSLAAPHHEGEDHHHHHDDAAPDRCEGIEMDAVAVNEEGIPYFFHCDHLFKGFHGKAEPVNESFTEMDEHHHLGHIDAAFRMHYEESPSHHNHMFLFVDHKVFSYYQHNLDEGYPKDISEVFPGIPNHLDAAVECPKPECEEDSVFFFKGDDIYKYNVKTKAVEIKEFKNLPNCTSAFRFMDHYYCFHGHEFSKFDPKTGEVHSIYPKHARDYFMRCSNYGNDSNHVERERCSRIHLDAITSDSAGNLYAFRSHHYIRKEKGNDAMTADTIESAFKELHSEVDAVFTYEGHFYMIEDEHIFVYKVDEPHTLLEGFPKPVKEELGIEGVDAAFTCEDHLIHVIKGQHVYDVDMKASPRVATNERPISLFKKVDAAMCGADGVTVVVGNYFYNFPSTMLMIAGRALPQEHRVALELFGCDH
ncbi:hemopexin [Diretmus argenteus]